MTIREAVTPEQSAACWPVMAQLRPHLSQEAFLQALECQRREGYVLVGGEVHGRVVAVAGFRILHMLSRGRFLYVDDLVTDEQVRSHGYGRLMMSWLKRRAAEEQCCALELDSGMQRSGAHRFYIAAGMAIPSLHFSLPIDGAHTAEQEEQ